MFSHTMLFIKSFSRLVATRVTPQLGWDTRPLGHLNPPVLCVSPQAYLRAVDVKILQQLVVVNEGIEAVKWLLEERSTLTSRCSSLASSQYSLVESQEASRRGSWDSLQDPNDRLDSISVGSYLDTLADDMDEYSHSAAETAAASTAGRALARAEQDWVRIDLERGPAKQEKEAEEHEWPHVDLSPPGLPQDQWLAKEPQRRWSLLRQKCPLGSAPGSVRLQVRGAVLALPFAEGMNAQTPQSSAAPLCDGAGGAQLRPIPAWLSATSSTGISRSIPLKTQPSQRQRACRQRAQHPLQKRPVSGFTLKTYPSEQILSPDAPAGFIAGWVPAELPARSRRSDPIRSSPLPCAGCVCVCVCDTPPVLFPAVPSPAGSPHPPRPRLRGGLAAGSLAPKLLSVLEAGWQRGLSLRRRSPGS
uniref:Leucine rich adaptor protein 1 n=31 Tax=Telluraves TaxID=3073808 RepID=A0A8D2LZV2_ZONAL